MIEKVFLCVRPLFVLACLTTGFAPDAIAGSRLGGRCLAMMAPLELSGTLAPMAVDKVFEWSTTCVGAFSASVRGGATLHVQHKQAGRWVVVATGTTTTLPRLGPGTYRIMVENRQQYLSRYTVTHRRGLG
jgi:hypothetical protein